MWWFEWEMAPTGSDVRILGTQLVALFAVCVGLGDVALLEEVRHWGQALRFQSRMPCHSQLALSALC